MATQKENIFNNVKIATAILVSKYGYSPTITPNAASQAHALIFQKWRIIDITLDDFNAYVINHLVEQYAVSAVNATKLQTPQLEALTYFIGDSSPTVKLPRRRRGTTQMFAW